MLRVPLVASLVELATGSCCASPWSWSPSPTAVAWPQLLGHDLDHGPGALILGGPAPLLKPAHDHDPAALAQGLAGVLSLVAPHDHGEERGLLFPPTAPRCVGRAGYWSWLLVDLAVVAVAQTRPPPGTNVPGPADLRRSSGCGWRRL
jgi:hypothetical protein